MNYSQNLINKIEKSWQFALENGRIENPKCLDEVANEIHFVLMDEYNINIDLLELECFLLENNPDMFE